MDRRIAALLALVGVAVAAVAGLRARRKATAPPPPPAPGQQPDETPAAKRVEATWTCQCGQDFRVSGEGRHRLFWLPDAPVNDPVLDDRCPACEEPLLAQQQEANAR